MAIYSHKDQIMLAQLVCEAIQQQNNIELQAYGTNRGTPVYMLKINNIFSGAFYFNAQTNTVTFYNSDMKNQVSQELPFPEAAETFKPQLDPLNGQQFRGIGLEGFKQKIESLISGNQSAQQPPAQAPTQQQAPSQPTQQQAPV